MIKKWIFWFSPQITYPDGFIQCKKPKRKILTVGHLLTINVPLFKKLRDIIFFLRDNHFLSRFKGHFEGAKTFLTP